MSIECVPITVEKIRERLRKMTDEELVRFGKAAREVCRGSVNRGKPPRDVFVIQLNEAKAEWLWRHPK